MLYPPQYPHNYGGYRQEFLSFEVISNNSFLLNPKQPSLLQGLSPLPQVERKSIQASWSQILGRAFQANKQLVPLTGKGEEKVKGLKTKNNELVLKEDTGVQTERLVELISDKQTQLCITNNKMPDC